MPTNNPNDAWAWPFAHRFPNSKPAAELDERIEREVKSEVDFLMESRRVAMLRTDFGTVTAIQGRPTEDLEYHPLVGKWTCGLGSCKWLHESETAARLCRLEWKLK